MRAAVTALAVLAAVGLAALAAGGGDGGRLRVSAAASLEPALERYAQGLAQRPSFSFAGSDDLAAQIRGGARPDVYAAASTELIERLRAEGLIEGPVPFARNRLVLAVPSGGDRVRRLADAARPGVTLAIGAAAVPVGSYTRRLLARLDPATRKAILANVRSDEPDVGGIAGKLTHRAVDAGFVYATDVRASRGKLRAIELPRRLRPGVVYAAAVVRGARDPDGARRFVRGLRGRAGRAALVEAGFEVELR